MKRAVILHGTDGTPDDNWQTWLKTQLEEAGYEVFAPQLPGCHKPNLKTYDKFLRESGWDFKDNVVIGHSSGATTVLNLLSAGWFPNIKAAVLAGTFLNEKLTKDADWVEPGQFANLFLDRYDPENLKQKSDKFYFIHGDNDPYCDIDDARKLCKEVGGTFITVKNGHHLGKSSGVSELPQLLAALQRDKVL